MEVEEVDPFVDHYGPDYVRFNLKSLDGRTGYFDRFFGRERKCQQSGELGWCYARDLDSPVALVEGIADAISVNASGFSSVSMMGTGNTKLAPLMLPLLGNRELILMLDGDGAGRRAELEIGRELLKMKRAFTVCRVPWGEDPASLGPVRANEILISGIRIGKLSQLLSF